MDIENITERFIRLSQDKDNRPLKEYMRGRSVGFRQAIYRQLKRWDCHESVDARLLKVKPAIN